MAFKVSIDLPRASIVSFPRSMAPDLFVLIILLQLAVFARAFCFHGRFASVTIIATAGSVVLFVHHMETY